MVKWWRDWARPPRPLVAYVRSAIFQNWQLSVAIKREVYHVMVLSTLLYGAETWTVKADSLRMRGFHNHYIRSMVGVSRLQQWKRRITSRELAETIGMMESMTEILRRHRLRWLGHVARMDDSRMPKQLLFGDHAPDMALRDGEIWCWRTSRLLDWKRPGMRWHRTNTSNPTNTESSYLCPWTLFQRQGDTQQIL